MLALDGQHRGWVKIVLGKILPLLTRRFCTFGMMPGASDRGSWSSVNKNIMFGRLSGGGYCLPERPSCPSLISGKAAQARGDTCRAFSSYVLSYLRMEAP